MSLEPWQLGNYPGGKQAKELNVKFLPRWLKDKEKAVVVLGDRVSLDDEEGAFHLEVAKKLIQKGVYTLATPKAFGKLSNEGIAPPKETASVPELIRRICDGKFPNLETVLLFGVKQYYLQAQALQALKHNWKGRILSLDPYFQPSATYSSRNVSRRKTEEWRKEVLSVVDQI